MTPNSKKSDARLQRETKPQKSNNTLTATPQDNPKSSNTPKPHPKTQPATKQRGWTPPVASLKGARLSNSTCFDKIFD